MKKKKKTTGLPPSRNYDGLNAEQMEKFSFGEESVDISGLVKRNRVLNQTVFDAMLLKLFIEQPQHEAACLFIDLLDRSGASVRSCGFEGPSAPIAPHAVGDHLAQRHMAYSESFRKMKDDAGDVLADLFLRVASNQFSFQDEEASLEELGVKLQPALRSLAKHFKTDTRRDPRRILRAQLGARS